MYIVDVQKYTHIKTHTAHHAHTRTSSSVRSPRSTRRSAPFMGNCRQFTCTRMEEDTCMSYEEEDIRKSYEEEDTCMSYEEEDICMLLGNLPLRPS